MKLKYCVFSLIVLFSVDAFSQAKEEKKRGKDKNKPAEQAPAKKERCNIRSWSSVHVNKYDKHAKNK